MYCLACDGKLPKIKEDSVYSNWNRKYHKKCWKERYIYYNLYERCLELGRDDQYFLKRSCLK